MKRISVDMTPCETYNWGQLRNTPMRTCEQSLVIQQLQGSIQRDHS